LSTVNPEVTKFEVFQGIGRRMDGCTTELLACMKRCQKFAIEIACGENEFDAQEGIIFDLPYGRIRLPEEEIPQAIPHEHFVARWVDVISDFTGGVIQELRRIGITELSDMEEEISCWVRQLYQAVSLELKRREKGESI
jgi:hypothetical protein